jgi:hypothetical protein
VLSTESTSVILPFKDAAERSSFALIGASEKVMTVTMGDSPGSVLAPEHELPRAGSGIRHVIHVSMLCDTVSP